MERRRERKERRKKRWRKGRKNREKKEKEECRPKGGEEKKIIVTKGRKEEC